MDVDSKGVVWAPLSSGHYASFDRRKCKAALNGPAAAAGQHCPEGWTLYPFPGPNYKGAVENGSADSAYYNFVDRFDMLGVGKDVPLATGNLSEGLLVLVDGKFVTASDRVGGHGVVPAALDALIAKARSERSKS